MADGRPHITSTMCTVKVRINEYKTSMSCYVLPITVSDIIMGKQWLTRENPDIDWRTNVTRVKKNNRVFKMYPVLSIDKA